MVTRGGARAQPVSPRPAEGKVTVAKKVEKSWPSPRLAPVVAAPASFRAQLIFTKRKLDEDTLQDLEDVLIRADLGIETALRASPIRWLPSRYGKERHRRGVAPSWRPRSRRC
jgi:fused signal recognition particle receptor